MHEWQFEIGKFGVWFQVWGLVHFFACFAVSIPITLNFYLNSYLLTVFANYAKMGVRGGE